MCQTTLASVQKATLERLALRKVTAHLEIVCSVPVHTCTHGTLSSSVMDNCKAYFSAVVLDCEENICENGGTCSRHVNDYSCDCPAGYSGILCDEGLFGHATNVVKSVIYHTKHMCTSAQLCTHYCTTAIMYHSHTHHGTACCTMSLLRHYRCVCSHWYIDVGDSPKKSSDSAVAAGVSVTIILLILTAVVIGVVVILVRGRTAGRWNLKQYLPKPPDDLAKE